MGNKVGDTFFDIYTFTAHSNKVGDTFHDLYTFTDHSNEWASFFQPNGFLIWDIYSFSGCAQYAQGMLSHTWKKQMKS